MNKTPQTTQAVILSPLNPSAIKAAPTLAEARQALAALKAQAGFYVPELRGLNAPIREQRAAIEECGHQRWRMMRIKLPRTA